MSIKSRFRSRREAGRRMRAVERVLHEAKTPAMRQEIIAITSRYYGN